MTTDTLHTQFKEAIDRGWSVIPIKARDKHPTIRWKSYQTKRATWGDAASWLGQWRDANLGIVTGEISGLIVLDVDGAEGWESMQALVGEGEWPQTPRVKTGRGWQLYFKHPGFPVRNFQKELPGLDLRGDGGYVVGAGSTHPNGSIYRWDISPDSCALADPSDFPWLMELITPRPDEEVYVHLEPAVGGTNGNGHHDSGYERAYALAALRREAEKVKNAPDGTKHERLRNSAIAVAGFVGALTESEIEEALYEAIRDRAKDKGKARQTIRDGIRYGSARRRRIPPKQELLVHLNGHRVEEALEDDQLAAMLRDAPLTDTGNAECMAAVYGDMFRYNHNLAKDFRWMVWDGFKWRVDEDGEAQRAAIRVVRARQKVWFDQDDTEKRKKAISYLIGCENEGKRRGLLTAASVLPEFTTTINQYDHDPWLAATSTGTADFRAGEIIAPRRSDLITMQLGTYFDGEATAPRWLRFLDEIFGGDQDLIAYIRRAAGYSLTGDTSEQKMFLCYGSGANGKSKFLEALSWLLGDYAGNTAFDTFDANRRSESSNDLAALKGKRLVTVIESEEDRRLAEARIKAVTGQDPITCRFLYGHLFTYMPTYKLWMAMNHKPVIRGTDRGIWRRIKLIPFERSFEGREDKNLERTLRAELPGIFNWALDGLREWREMGLGTARAVETATDEFKRESDIVGQWMQDTLMEAPREVLTANEVYTSFREWCKAHGFREPTATSLGRSLVEKGYKSERVRGQRAYSGLAFRPLSVD